VVGGAHAVANGHWQPIKRMIIRSPNEGRAANLKSANAESPWLSRTFPKTMRRFPDNPSPCL